MSNSARETTVDEVATVQARQNGLIDLAGLDESIEVATDLPDRVHERPKFSDAHPATL